MENTSLFAEVKLSEKITEEMKSKIIGDKENNVIPKLRPRYKESNYDACESLRCYCCCRPRCCYCRCYDKEEGSDDDEGSADEKGSADDFDVGCRKAKRGDDSDDDREDIFESKKEKCCEINEPIKEKEVIKKEGENIDMNEKENIMKMIGTQNFIEGFWEENEYTKKIKDTYKKEYDLIKGMKNKNMNEKIALTILSNDN